MNWLISPASTILPRATCGARRGTRFSVRFISSHKSDLILLILRDDELCWVRASRFFLTQLEKVNRPPASFTGYARSTWHKQSA